MQKTRGLRYTLFTVLFALVLVGMVVRSYSVLAVLAIVAVILGVIADKVENRPTEPFKKYNELHHHGHGHNKEA